MVEIIPTRAPRFFNSFSVDNVSGKRRVFTFMCTSASCLYSCRKELKKRGARVGIISTKYRFRILSYLEEYLPKDFLDIVVGGEDVKAPKPSPEGVLFALEHLGSTPEETLYIGDSTVDAETARNAGVDFAGVLNGMTTAEELRIYPHKIIMQNFGELVQ